MHRILIFFVIIAFLLSACGSATVTNISPTEITIASTTPSIDATQLSTSVPVTQPAMTQSPPETGWLSALETITPKNWARLQLLQTFPAEIPMLNSVVAIAPNGKTMLMGSNQKAQLFFFDLESGKISSESLYIHDVKNIDAPFDVIKYLSDGSILASSHGPYAIYHIDSTGNVLSAWDGLEFSVSADQQTIAFEINDGTSLVNIANNTPMVLLQNTNGLGSSFSPDNSKIAIDTVTVDYANVDIWDIKSQTIIKTLDNMYDVSYSPNGKFLAMLDDVDSSLKIFSPDGAVLLATIPDAYSEYLISPDGSFIAYQTAKGSSVAKDTTNWETYETALQGSIDSFSSDGRILVTRTDDGGVLIWGVRR